MTFPTKVLSDSLGWIGRLKRTSDKSLFSMALGNSGHRITHQLRPINMNGRSILSETSLMDFRNDPPTGSQRARIHDCSDTPCDRRRSTAIASHNANGLGGKPGSRISASASRRRRSISSSDQKFERGQGIGSCGPGKSTPGPRKWPRHFGCGATGASRINGSMPLRRPRPEKRAVPAPSHPDPSPPRLKVYEVKHPTRSAS